MTVLTVSQVNTYIKALINEIPQVKNLYISGEISNFKHYYQSGHMYFTLKDEKSQLKCVMFSSDNYKLKFTPSNGLKVICFGQVDVYERDGVYQLYVRDMHPEGIGSLTLAFEQLKDKLEKEGLFAASAKKPLPRYPQKIGIATSNMGAAVEDIKKILGRRFPLAEVVIVPTVVQGDAAAPDIVKSLELLDAMPDIDVIIVGRGGGSMEDLWAFNTEAVARAVYRCHTPVISAVGHETDFTICDFVADERAATPSAAAERAVPDKENELFKIRNLSASLEMLLTHKIEAEEQRLTAIKEKSPLANIDVMFASLERHILELSKGLQREYQSILNGKEASLKTAAAKLNALSPLAVLGRGYSVITKNNTVTSSVNDIHIDDKVELILKDGRAAATITEVKGNG